MRVIEDCPDEELNADKVPAYMRGFRYNGMYVPRRKNGPAQILLYANDVYFGIPKVFLKSRMATLKIARTLTHEVGHHVIATRGYIYDPSEKYRPWNGIRNPAEEDMVDRYASDVLERMKRQLSYKVAELQTQTVSHLLYKAGLQDYFAENYKASASRQARAHSLNPKNEEAGQCFRHAIEKLKAQTPSPLTDAERDWLFNKYSPKALTTGRKPFFTGKR